MTTRRSFLKTLSLAGVCAALPMNLLSQVSYKHRIHFVGIGYLSSHVLADFSKLADKGLPGGIRAAYTCICDTPLTDMARSHALRECDLDSYQPSESFPAFDQHLYLVDLGDAKAAALAEACGSFHSTNEASVRVITFLPFRFEGIKTRAHAEASRNRIAMLADCYTFDLERLRQEHGSLQFGEAFGLLQKQTFLCLKQLVKEGFNRGLLG